MIPVYILTLIFSTSFLLNRIKSRRNKVESLESKELKLDKPVSLKTKVFKYILIIAGFLCVVIAGIILFLFPIVDLPKPTSSYVVGTTYVDFYDTKRSETLTEDAGDFRKFRARVWYPADSALGNPMIYRKDIPQIGIIEPAGTPNFIFGHYNLIKTNSYLNLPVSNKQLAYPVLVFSNGFLAGYDDYQLLMEELASHGFIVFSPNQPYESQSVVNSDGSVTPFSSEHLDKYQKHQEVITPLWRKFWTSADEGEKKDIVKKILNNESFMDTVLRIRTDDVQFMVNKMEKINLEPQNNIFFSKLDLTRLGILGHSMGGAVAGQVCLVDNRFKAGVNIDGFQWGDVVNKEIQQPFMIMQSEQFSGANDFILDKFKNELYLVTIKNSKHMNFDDNQIIMPSTKLIGMTGKIDANKMRQITNDFILSFFDKYLNNNDTPFPSEVLSGYPEVEIRTN